MTDLPPIPEHYSPGAPYPDPAATTYGIRWASTPPADQSAHPSGWADADPPAAVPPPIPGTEGPHTRPGWLTAGR